MIGGIRIVCRYQLGFQHPYIEEGQTTQCPKEKVQKDKQRSTKHRHKAKDRLTRTQLKTRDALYVCLSCLYASARGFIDVLNWYDMPSYHVELFMFCTFILLFK